MVISLHFLLLHFLFQLFCCLPKQTYVFIELLFTAARGREDSISSTYDTFVPNQNHGLQQLIELQQRVKAGSLTVDGALERFGDWKRVQKGTDADQQVGPSHPVIALTLDLERRRTADQTLIKL